MSLRKIALIAGARPNFMKITPIYREFKKRGADFIVINTGQHFSSNMNDDFLKEFDLFVDHHLQPRHDHPVNQIADIINDLARLFVQEKIDLVIVVGDVNSTLAAAITANKLGIKLAHVEAGLRSRNYQMPEELNRIITDNLSDYLLAPSADAVDNLKEERVHGRVDLVGNIMIDNLIQTLSQVPVKDEHYYYCTLHRAENVDDPEIFADILSAIEKIAADAPVYLPLHPRTEKMARQFGLEEKLRKIFKVLPPLNYLEAITYQKSAKLILTDSGGVQEEATILQVPCLTIRTETERPITVERGTNIVGGVKPETILAAYLQQRTNPKQAQLIDLWDGKTAERIANVVLND